VEGKVEMNSSRLRLLFHIVTRSLCFDFSVWNRWRRNWYECDNEPLLCYERDLWSLL